jgi:hypothetical protein
MLGVGLVEQVVDADRQLRALVEVVLRIHRDHAKASTRSKILTDDIPLVQRIATLRRHDTPQTADRPLAPRVIGAQTHLEWRNLRQRAPLSTLRPQA